MSKSGRGLLVVVSFFILPLLFSVLLDRITGAFLERDSAGGGLLFPPRSTFRYQTPEFDFTAHINSLGFRDREFALDKGGVTRILAVGDSFTYGWGVAADESWPKLLEAGLRRMGDSVEVANLGQPGASPATYAQTAAKAIPLLKPDLVIISILQGDDLASGEAWEAPQISSAGIADKRPAPAVSSPRLRDRLGNIGRRMYPNFLRLLSNHIPQQPLTALWKEQAQTIVVGLTPVERVQFDKVDVHVRRAFLNGELNPALMQGAIKRPSYFLDTYDVDKPEVRSLISAMAGSLAQIRETAEGHGCKVLVISVPYKVYASRRDLESSRRLGFNLIPEMAEGDSADRAIESACQVAGVRFFSVTDRFRKAADATHLFYEMDGHLNPAGHRVFADLVAPLLADNGMRQIE